MNQPTDLRAYYGRRFDQGWHGHLMGDREAWIDQQIAKHGADVEPPSTPDPGVVRFDSQDALEEYVETELNEKGIDPSVALIDSAGVQTVAHRTAPGGDGYAFVYAIHDRDPESGSLHCCDCYECGTECTAFMGEWAPAFPVWVFKAGV